MKNAGCRLFEKVNASQTSTEENPLNGFHIRRRKSTGFLYGRFIQKQIHTKKYPFVDLDLPARSVQSYTDRFGSHNHKSDCKKHQAGC